MHLVLGVEDAHHVTAALGQRGVERGRLVLRPRVVDDDPDPPAVAACRGVRHLLGARVVVADDGQDLEGGVVQLGQLVQRRPEHRLLVARRDDEREAQRRLGTARPPPDRSRASGRPRACARRGASTTASPWRRRRGRARRRAGQWRRASVSAPDPVLARRTALDPTTSRGPLGPACTALGVVTTSYVVRRRSRRRGAWWSSTACSSWWSSSASSTSSCWRARVVVVDAAGGRVRGRRRWRRRSPVGGRGSVRRHTLTHRTHRDTGWSASRAGTAAEAARAGAARGAVGPAAARHGDGARRSRTRAA